MAVYCYQAYGLNIQSDIIFTELLPSEGDSIDVYIKLGTIPDQLESVITNYNAYQTSKTELLWNLDDIGSFYIHDGIEMICQLDENVDSGIYKPYILGMCMSVLMLQRNILPIHCSAIEYKGEAILFVGQSGSGKSSIGTYLRSEGYRLLSDDIIAIRFDQFEEGDILAYPSFPLQKVTEHMASEFNLELDTDLLVTTDSKRAKYHVDFRDSFSPSPLTVKAIVELDVDELIEKPICKIVKGSEKVEVMINNIFGYQFIHDLTLDHDYFYMITKIIKSTTILAVKRPKDLNTVNEQFQLISETIGL